MKIALWFIVLFISACAASNEFYCTDIGTNAYCLGGKFINNTELLTKTGENPDQYITNKNFQCNMQTIIYVEDGLIVKVGYNKIWDSREPDCYGDALKNLPTNNKYLVENKRRVQYHVSIRK